MNKCINKVDNKQICFQMIFNPTDKKFKESTSIYLDIYAQNMKNKSSESLILHFLLQVLSYFLSGYIYYQDDFNKDFFQQYNEENNVGKNAFQK